MSDRQEQTAIHLSDQATAAMRDAWAKLSCDELGEIGSATMANDLSLLQGKPMWIVLATISTRLGEEHLRRAQAGMRGGEA